MNYIRDILKVHVHFPPDSGFKVTHQGKKTIMYVNSASRARRPILTLRRHMLFSWDIQHAFLLCYSI